MNTKLVTTDRPVALDLGDDRLYGHLLDVWRDEGRTPERMPHLFTLLERTRESHKRRGGPPPLPDQATASSSVATLTGVGLTVNPEGGFDAVASALVSVPGGADYTSISLKLFRVDTGMQIGEALVDAFASGAYMPVQASGQIEAADVPLRAELVTAIAQSSVATDGRDPLTVVAQGALLSGYPATPPLPTAPVQKPGRTVDYTLVCLLRADTDQADCDYGPYGVNTVRVPVAGSISYFDDIQPFSAENSSATLYVVTRKNGGGTRYYLSGVDMASHFVIGPDNKTMAWSYDVADFGVQDPFERYEYVDIVLQFNVTTAAGPDQISAWVSSAVDAVAGPSVGKVLPLQFATGCVAAGTVVALAGGGTRAVERLAPGDRVLAGPPVPALTVRSTVSGPEDRPMILVRTKGGIEALVTEGHPVMLSDAAHRVAGALAIGDCVLTIDGVDAVASVERRPFDGLVWNAALGTDAERAQSPGAPRAFYANGLLVGDAALQVTAAKAPEDPGGSDVLDCLPEEWHADYLARSGGRARL